MSFVKSADVGYWRLNGPLSVTAVKGMMRCDQRHSALLADQIAYDLAAAGVDLPRPGRRTTVKRERQWISAVLSSSSVL
jgi:hypothetical protein